MICYFVRHGAAIAPEDWRGSDFDRPLTEKGRERTGRLARHLAKAEVEVDEIVTSPLVRAKETARIIAEALGVGDVVEDARLASGFDPGRLESILRDHETAEALMLVGHEPTMSATLGYAIGGARIDFKKGAIACVDVTGTHPPSGILLWAAPPKLLAG